MKPGNDAEPVRKGEVVVEQKPVALAQEDSGGYVIEQRALFRW
jgi:hypothetical protein